MLLVSMIELAEENSDGKDGRNCQGVSHMLACLLISWLLAVDDR